MEEIQQNTKWEDLEFYDTNGEKVDISKLSFVPTEDKKEDIELLEKLKEETGYLLPKICNGCGEYYEGYENIWSINGDERCSHCVSKDDRTRLPIFVKYVSDIHYGGTTIETFTFKDANELYDIMKKHILNSSDILVKKNEQSVALVGQSSVSRYDGSYILGYIHNFDMDLLNIPISNYNVYNDDETINIDKMNEWLKGKDVVKL